MMVSLTPAQQAWLQASVDRGEFRSIDDAARQLIDERVAERIIEEADDLAWAKPYVDEALAAVGRGDVISLDEYMARRVVTIPAKDWEAFEAWLDRPGETIPALAELARRTPSWER